MNIAFNICTLVFFIFGLVYGNECEMKNEEHIGCPVYRIEPQGECQTYLSINDGDRDFTFYIKPLNKGKLTVSLHRRYTGGQSSEISNILFILDLNDTNKWQKIKIQRGKLKKAKCYFRCFVYTYFLDIDDKPHFHIGKNIEAGNEIRIQTVPSLWSTTSCDPRLHVTTQIIPQSVTESPASIQPSLLSPKSLKNDNVGILESITHNIPVWQLALVSSATLLLILATVLVSVVIILTHKKTNHGPVLILPTDHQSRLSRHMSENSLYESYDNPCTRENPVVHVVTPAPGTGWETSADLKGRGQAAFPGQRRGSSHDSENSLYVGFI